ncbi:mycofactocin biosynthesis chaperone MftB [Nocardioides sp. HB32]
MRRLLRWTSTSPGRCRRRWRCARSRSGALAYHFGNRKLIFLKRPELVAVVRGLGAVGGDGSVRSALVAAGVPEAGWPAYLAALEGLAASDMIARVA